MVYDHSPATPIRCKHTETLYIFTSHQKHVFYITRKGRRDTSSVKRYFRLSVLLIICVRRFSVSLTYRQSCSTHRRANAPDSFIPDDKTTTTTTTKDSIRFVWCVFGSQCETATWLYLIDSELFWKRIPSGIGRATEQMISHSNWIEFLPLVILSLRVNELSTEKKSVR